MTKMKKTAVYVVLVLLVVLAFWLVQRNRRESAAAGQRAAKARQAPVPAVLTNVVVKPMPVELRTFGVVEPLAMVTVKSQVTGVLTNVLFEEGQEVHEGDLLFVVDPRPAEAALKQAEATLARVRCELENAEKEFSRQEELLKKGITSQDLRDQAFTAMSSLRASVAAGEAAVDNARLQVGYCSIRSPLNGRIGSRLVDCGNLVKANDVAMAVINQVRPIRVRFSLPQQELGRIREKAAAGKLAVKATIPGAAPRSESGELVFIDNAVDTTTGTIQLKALYPNGDGALWPGQYVDVTVQLAVQDGVLVVPTGAVLPGQNGSYVYVASAEGVVTNRPVVVDRQVGQEIVIAGGLAAGESVVVDGQLRLAPGARVILPGMSGKPSSPSARP